MESSTDLKFMKVWIIECVIIKCVCVTFTTVSMEINNISLIVPFCLFHFDSVCFMIQIIKTKQCNHLIYDLIQSCSNICLRRQSECFIDNTTQLMQSCWVNSFSFPPGSELQQQTELPGSVNLRLFSFSQDLLRLMYMFTITEFKTVIEVKGLGFISYQIIHSFSNCNNQTIAGSFV